MAAVDEFKKNYPDVELFVITRGMGRTVYKFYFPRIVPMDIAIGSSKPGLSSFIKSLSSILSEASLSEFNEEKLNQLYKRILNDIIIDIQKNGESVPKDSVHFDMVTDVIDEWLDLMGIFERVEVARLPYMHMGSAIDAIKYDFNWGGYRYSVIYPDLSSYVGKNDIPEFANIFFDFVDQITNTEISSEELGKKFYDLALGSKITIGRSEKEVMNYDPNAFAYIFNRWLQDSGLIFSDYEVV